MSVMSELERLDIEIGHEDGIFILDFGAYYPVWGGGQKLLQLDASLSTKLYGDGDNLSILDMSVLNYRYPNQGYVCMTGKFGRKLCKIGCPVLRSYEELNRFKYLNIGYGLKGKEFVHMAFPIEINLSQTAPCCSAEIHLNLKYFDVPGLTIHTHERSKNGEEPRGWHPHTYDISRESGPAMCTIVNNGENRFTLLTPANTKEDAEESGWIIFNETVKMISDTVENTLV